MSHLLSGIDGENSELTEDQYEPDQGLAAERESDQAFCGYTSDVENWGTPRFVLKPSRLARIIRVKRGVVQSCDALIFLPFAAS